MKKIKNFFSSIVFFLVGLVLLVSGAFADIVFSPDQGRRIFRNSVFPPDGAGVVFPGDDNSTIVLIGAGAGVAAVSMVSWLVISSLRIKKNVSNK